MSKSTNGHEYSEDCFCVTCTAFRMAADEDFMRMIDEIVESTGQVGGAT